MPRPLHPSPSAIELSLSQALEGLRAYQAVTVAGAGFPIRSDLIGDVHRLVVRCDDEILALMASLRFQQERETEAAERLRSPEQRYTL